MAITSEQEAAEYLATQYVFDVPTCRRVVDEIVSRHGTPKPSPRDVMRAAGTVLLHASQTGKHPLDALAYLQAADAPRCAFEGKDGP